MPFERFVLRTSARWLTIQPLEADTTSLGVAHDKLLFFDRTSPITSAPFAVRDRVECAGLASPDSEAVVFGLVGVVTLLADAYLIVVDARTSVGSLREAGVFRAKLRVVPVRGSKALKAAGVEKSDLAEEARLAAALCAAVALPGFYFSHDMDITRSAQRCIDGGAGGKAAFEKADMRFVWNRYVGREIAASPVCSWLVPLILGYVEVKRGLVNGKAVELGIVSRRGVERPGLRYTARGADIHGHVSNFVETEQVVGHGDHFASYVQVRGSIPLLWQQEACIRYKPKAVLKTVDAGGKTGLSQGAFEKHYKKLFEVYGPVTAISLIDTHGSEAAICAALSNAVDNFGDPRLHFVHWDFHVKTKGMKYEAVDEDLLAIIDRDLGAYSYMLVADGNAQSPSLRQKGVVRTNCIDSLDRTNVVQSVIAHRIMDDALKHMGVLNSSPETCTASAFKEFESAFKNAWADNADALSNVYAGSGALKTDYTRTGKRSKPGMARDLAMSARRYFYNNFLDGKRQDGIDLLLGVVNLDKVTQGKRDVSLVKRKVVPLPVARRFLPHGFGLCTLLSIASAIALPQWWQKLLGGTGCIALGVAILSVIAKGGEEFATRPTLNGTS